MYVLGLTSVGRGKGRKAAGYVPVRTIEDVRQMLVDDLLHSDAASGDQVRNIGRNTHRP